MPEVNCTCCKKLVHKNPCQIKRNLNNFCSLACRGAYTRKRLAVTCTHCGTEIHRIPRYIERSRTHFCSRVCYTAYQRTGCITAEGYRVLTRNRKQIREHRLIMETALGRKLLPGEIVHHINGDRSDNRLENLAVMENSAHVRGHKPLTWDLEQAKAMRAEGLSFKEIGKELGITGDAIRLVFLRRGLHSPDPKHPKFRAKFR
jgi:HNH endonuclease